MNLVLGIVGPGLIGRTLLSQIAQEVSIKMKRVITKFI